MTIPVSLCAGDPDGPFGGMWPAIYAERPRYWCRLVVVLVLLLLIGVVDLVSLLL